MFTRTGLYVETEFSYGGTGGAILRACLITTIIMTLKGDISLSHNNDNWIDLPGVHAACFDGGDETASKER